MVLSEANSYGSTETTADVTNPFGEITQSQLDELAYFQQRYKEEREKRLRPDGLAQYSNVSTTERLKKFWEDPWVTSGTPVHEPVRDGGSIKLMILGAGADGVLQAVECIKAGMSAEDILFVDVAAGFGGAWYWNRYPGAACDTESYCYMPMLEEMNHMPSRKYAPGWEFRRHYERIATRYHLQDRAMWQTWSQTAHWNADAKDWVVSLLQKPKGGPEKQITVHAKYVVLAAGLQSIPKMPNLEGLDTYAGHMFLASRWDYDYTGGSPEDQQLWNLSDKRVGLIGNAASGGQAIVELAKYAKDVYMFQRTPASIFTPYCLLYSSSAFELSHSSSSKTTLHILHIHIKMSTSSTQRTTYPANCHCNAIRYTVTLDEALAPSGPGKINKCNCSICTKLGYLLVYPKREDVVFEEGCEEKLKDYFFGKKRKPHRFCGECGSSVLIDFKDSDCEKQRGFLAMNTRLFKDIDLDKAEYTTFDGKARLEPAYEF